MNKKIVILHPAHWEQTMGGAEIQIKYLIEYLIEIKVEVHFIFEDASSPIENALSLKLHPLKKINISKRIGNRWFLYQKRIYKLLQQIEPDAIYTRFYSSWSGFASDYAIKSTIPHVWAIASNNDLLKQTQEIPFYKIFDLVENRIVSRAFFQATHILVQNKEQQHELKKRYQREGALLTQAAPLVYEDKIPSNMENIKIVWIANLKALKRPELFLEIVKKLSKTEGFEFIMIGRLNSEYLDLIEQTRKINSNFSYLGELNNDEVNTILLQSHVLINTSDYEGFSNTFVQAWLRKNIVISMNSNPDEIITTQKVGYLIPGIDEIVEILKYLLLNKNELNEMMENAYVYSQANHNLDRNLKHVSKLLSLK